MAIPQEDRKVFEEMGEAQVRLQYNAKGFSSPRQNFARQWLAERVEAERVRYEALQAEETQRSESTLKAAWIAVYMAIGALVLSVIAIIISVLAWLHPHN